jgi:hypothetical protein
MLPNFQKKQKHYNHHCEWQGVEINSETMSPAMMPHANTDDFADQITSPHPIWPLIGSHDSVRNC